MINEIVKKAKEVLKLPQRLFSKEARFLEKTERGSWRNCWC